MLNNSDKRIYKNFKSSDNYKRILNHPDYIHLSIELNYDGTFLL